MNKQSEHHFHPTHKTIAFVAFSAVILLGMTVFIAIIPFTLKVIDESQHSTRTVADELPLDFPKFNF